MLSRISIEMDFTKATPFIKVFSNPSPDLRDQAVQAFFEKLLQKSRWATVTFEGGGAEFNTTGGNSYSIWHITPLTLSELRNEAKLMLALADHLEGKLELSTNQELIDQP